MTEQMNRALFTIASLGINRPIPAIDLLATSSWLESVGVVKSEPLASYDVVKFLQQLIDLQAILQNNTHRLATVPVNQQPSRQQYQVFLNQVNHFRERYVSIDPTSFEPLFEKSFHFVCNN